MRKVCSVGDCERFVHGHGLCRLHYKRERRAAYRAANPLPPRVTVCTVDGCDEPFLAKGYCKAHYQEVRKKAPKLVITEKKCASCGMTKAVSEHFQPRSDSDDGYRNKCRECQKADRPRCDFPDCGRPRASHGLCMSHVRQKKKGVELHAIGSRPRVAHNKLDAAEAEAVLVAAGFQPTTPYVKVNTRWPGYCLRCHQPGAPAVANVRHLGTDPCMYCTGQVIPEEIRYGRMVAAGFTPLEPYPGSAHANWRVRHKCGAETSIRYMNIALKPRFCLACNEMGGYNLSVDGYFYVVTDGAVIKAGVTNVPERRLETHARQGLTQVAHLIGPIDPRDAWEMEQEWKRYIKSSPEHMRVTSDHIKEGFTEALVYHPSVLQSLDFVIETTNSQEVDAA